MKCRIADFRYKEVVNISTGFRMGMVCDVVFDTVTGQVLSLIVPGPTRFFGMLGKGEDYSIPWASIRKIGEDIILVEGEEIPKCEKRRTKGWFS